MLTEDLKFDMFIFPEAFNMLIPVKLKIDVQPEKCNMIVMCQYFVSSLICKFSGMCILLRVNII